MMSSVPKWACTKWAAFYVNLVVSVYVRYNTKSTLLTPYPYPFPQIFGTHLDYFDAMTFESLDDTILMSREASMLRWFNFDDKDLREWIIFPAEEIRPSSFSDVPALGG